MREYFLFHFYERTPEERDTFVTTARRDEMIHEIGDDETINASAPGNKILFNRLFGEFLCREWLNPTTCTGEEFADFARRHRRVMVKPARAGRGEGLAIYEYESAAAALAFHASLQGQAMLVEEIPVQHPQMDRLNPNCINTRALLHLYRPRRCTHPPGRAPLGQGREFRGQRGRGRHHHGRRP